jgi:NhaA family Na+:H+ antiporter
VRWARFVLDNSLLLLAGTVVALAWANLDLHRYESIAAPLHFWINDVGMAFFFALAAKEVFEATLPGGALASPRTAASPLAAAVGGMAAPAQIYVGLAMAMGSGELTRGWAIPCATDIAFSAMVARVVFPRRHPAVPFLLLLAIADDALGLAILAIFYPSGSLAPLLFGAVMLAAIALAWALRRGGVTSFWAYLAGPGVLSWAALFFGGFHPALALVPIVPLMPHGATDLGLFEHDETARGDTLSHFERWWSTPVQIVLLLFGFANAGVPLEAVGAGTACVALGLLIGKPIGIIIATWVVKQFGAAVPAGVRVADLLLIGVTASIGFTVSLFFATAAFPPGLLQSETKMGALLSFAAAPLAIAISRARKRVKPAGVHTP